MLILGIIWVNWPKHRIEPAEIKPTPTAAVPVDPRVEKLNRFFDHYKCKEPRYVNEYLASADKYKIPYTLLPAISVLESTCGQHQLYSNWWGFWSDRQGFPSVSFGIDFVSSQLNSGRYYAGKTINGKLHAYNPNPSYALKVQLLINQIDNP